MGWFEWGEGDFGGLGDDGVGFLVGRIVCFGIERCRNVLVELDSIEVLTQEEVTRCDSVDSVSCDLSLIDFQIILWPPAIKAYELRISNHQILSSDPRDRLFEASFEHMRMHCAGLIDWRFVTKGK